MSAGRAAVRIGLVLTTLVAVPIEHEGSRAMLAGEHGQRHGVLTEREESLPVLPGSVGTLHHPSFNRDGARRSFRRAASLDADAAMPLVGVALALGPNLNMESTPDQRAAACAASRQARTLARHPDVLGYADALMTWYCGSMSAERAVTYASAMRVLRDQFLADPDAATLYADSLLALRHGTREEAAEIIAVLESVLQRWPDHVGANHYYVHAAEGSPTPERALPSARRPEVLVPAIGHLLHMPSHIYFRMGDYAQAVAANVRAAAADLAYLRANPADDDQRMYYEHDLESLAGAAGFAGRFEQARQAAQAVARQQFSSAVVFVLLRFHRWQDILRLPAPPLPDPPSTLLTRGAYDIPV